MTITILQCGCQSEDRRESPGIQHDRCVPITKKDIETEKRLRRMSGPNRAFFVELRAGERQYYLDRQPSTGLSKPDIERISLSFEQQLIDQANTLCARFGPDLERRAYFADGELPWLARQVRVKTLQRDEIVEVPVFIFNSRFGVVVSPVKPGRDQERMGEIKYGKFINKFVSLSQNRVNPELTDLKIVNLARGLTSNE